MAMFRAEEEFSNEEEADEELCEFDVAKLEEPAATIEDLFALAPHILMESG